jgi:GNAT superfamily N-acetyltransferase
LTSPPRGEVDPAHVAISEVGEDPTTEIAAVMQIDREVAAARMSRGCRCFVARHGGEVVAFGWLAIGTEWIGEVELEITPGADAAYIWNCATHPAHRRQGFFRALVTGIAAQARREGFKRLWIGTLDIPAAKGVADVGFVPAIRFTTVWHAGIRWLRARPAEAVNPDLLMSAREVLAIAGRPLRLGSSMKRATRRRH